MYDISKARNRQAAGARCNKTVTLRRLCYRGPLRGPAPPKRGSFLIYYHEAAQGCTRGCNLGEGAEGRGVFGLSAGARFARPPLAYPVGGTGKEDPSSVTAFAATPSPHRGRLWGGWKPAGDLGPLRRGGACPRPSLACSVTGTGGRRTPHPPRLAPPHLPPTGGRLLGRLEACGRFWASAQGRGLPPPVSGMLCDWYGGGGPSSAAARAATPSPTGGRLWGGHGVLMDHERKRPDLLRVRPLFYSFSNR